MLVLKPGEEVPLVDPLITSPGKRPGSRGSRPGSRGSSAGRVERTGPTIKRKEETVIEGLADALRELRVEGEAVVQTNESKLGHIHNPELTLKEIHDDSQPIDDHVDDDDGDDDEDEESSSSAEESSDEDDDEMTGASVATKSTTSPLVPVELLSKFLSFLMTRDYEAALPICSQILEIEPQNETCLQYRPLLEYAVNNDVDSGNEESGGSDEDDDDDDEDGEDEDDDESESSDDEDDDDDDEESDSDDDEDEEENISVKDLKGVNMFMGGFVKKKLT